MVSMIGRCLPQTKHGGYERATWCAPATASGGGGGGSGASAAGSSGSSGARVASGSGAGAGGSGGAAAGAAVEPAVSAPFWPGAKLSLAAG